MALTKDSIHAGKDPTLFEAFTKGSVHGKFRYYFMSTINKGSLKDFYANAAGGYLRYSTHPFHKFRFVVGSSFTFNILSTDLTVADPATGSRSRYEWGLFDFTDIGNRFNMARLDELQLQYEWGTDSVKNSVKLGKQAINTPFINEQDGRMRPTVVDAAWFNYRRHRIGVEGGWIYGVSPRGAPYWYSVGQSIGLYGVGVNDDGSRSEHHNNVKTAGVAIAGLKYDHEGVSLQLWEQYVENVFNTGMLQGEYDLRRRGNNSLKAGLQIIRQDAVNDGGNANPTKTYITPGKGNWIVSCMLGFEKRCADTNRWLLSFNYTRIGANRRYLMPREWGREPFYTFIPRERNEGNGDVHASVARVGKEFRKRRLLTELAMGYYEMADVKNYKLNKYGTVSYGHLYARARYIFDRSLKGLNAELVYVYKKKMGEDYGNDRYVINRVDMSMFNLIVDYKF